MSDEEFVIPIAKECYVSYSGIPSSLDQATLVVNTDYLYPGIDPKIANLVKAILIWGNEKELGFKEKYGETALSERRLFSTMSCEGHVAYNANEPWIDIKSTLSARNDFDSLLAEFNENSKIKWTTTTVYERYQQLYPDQSAFQLHPAFPARSVQDLGDMQQSAEELSRFVFEKWRTFQYEIARTTLDFLELIRKAQHESTGRSKARRI